MSAKRNAWTEEWSDDCLTARSHTVIGWIGQLLIHQNTSRTGKTEKSCKLPYRERNERKCYSCVDSNYLAAVIWVKNLFRDRYFDIASADQKFD